MGGNAKFLLEELSFSLPNGWRERTDGADEAKVFEIYTKSGEAVMGVEPISRSDAMPCGQDQALIDFIHQKIIDHESGLIELATVNGRKIHSVYSIIKRRANDPGNPALRVFYSGLLYAHILSGNGTYSDKAYIFRFTAKERGATGMRDAEVYNQAMLQGVIAMDENAETGEMETLGWSEDPYNPDFVDGFLMNMSERAAYDSLFPDHPLTLLREAINEISSSIKVT